jgi:hypothetical protein
VDAFAYSWEKEFCWIVPPPNLTPKVISHCKRCKSKGLLIIPKWKASFFWPTLHDGTHWANGIELLLEYKNPVNFFKRGPFGNDTFTEKQFNSNVLILKIDFTN